MNNLSEIILPRLNLWTPKFGVQSLNSLDFSNGLTSALGENSVDRNAARTTSTAWPFELLREFARW